ncbi:MAG: CvpA family protein [Myxococcota bacterium]
MLIDLGALLILAVFIFIGAMRGGLASGVGVVTLVLSYLVGVLCAQRFGGVLAQGFAVQPLLATPLAGSIGFGVTFILFSLIGLWLVRMERERRGDFPRGGGDRFAGGIFGALRGGLIVLLLGWLVLWLDAAHQMGVGPGFAGISDVGRSNLAAATGAVVETAVGAALSDAGPGGRLAARIAARPAATLQSVQALLETPALRAVQEDPLFWTYVQNGAIENALNRGSFWRVIHDDELRGQLGDLGLIDAGAVADPDQFRQVAGDLLEELGPRLKGLSNDPDIHRLANDPEILAMLEAGDTLGLMGHPDVQRVVSRVSAGL